MAQDAEANGAAKRDRLAQRRRAPSPPVPRQLPAAVAHLTGRDAELQALTRILDDAGAGAPGTVVISAIGGTAGVGKTATGAKEARRLLGELARAHLIAEHVPGRYAFHDLLRAYAADQARTHDSDSDRTAAATRLLDHYLHSAYPAALLVDPRRDPLTIAPPIPGVTPEPVTGGEQALAWFEAEHHVLLAVVSLAADSGPDAHAWQLPWTMADYLERRGHLHEWAAVQGIAVDGATRAGDPLGQAVSFRLLGNAYNEPGDYDQAHGYFGTSLELYRRAGHRLGEAKVQQALVFCRRSVALSVELGDRHDEACAWDSLGYAESHLGNLGEAAACYDRALGAARDAGNRWQVRPKLAGAPAEPVTDWTTGHGHG